MSRLADYFFIIGVEDKSNLSKYFYSRKNSMYNNYNYMILKGRND